MDQHELSYIINHLGEDREQYYHSVAPPVIQSSNFALPTVAELRQRVKNEFKAPFYTRGYNPTVAILRKKLAALEKTDDALVFSSGSAAIATAMMALLQAGDHVVSVQKPYSWSNTLLNKLLARYGVSTTMVDGTDPENYRKAIRPETKVLFLESPNSMTFELQDIAAVVAIAREHNCLTVMDNSYATPLYQNPVPMGVDLVAHSASKYFGGHSDIVAGVLCGRQELIDRIFANEFMTLGTNISPHDAWLMLRGLRTLPVRIEKAHQNAMKVADFLAGHPKVEKLNYPFHPSHPQYELARKQMKGAGGLMSIQIRANDFSDVERFCDALNYFLLTNSWGGYESLAIPLCIFAENKESYRLELPWNLIRLYIGIEDVDVLIDDLKQALEKV